MTEVRQTVLIQVDGPDKPSSSASSAAAAWRSEDQMIVWFSSMVGLMGDMPRRYDFNHG